MSAAAAETETIQPLFRDLDLDDHEPETTEIQSLCLNCGRDGTTRLMLTKIPNLKDIILMSFSCPHCGWSNNETQFGGKIQEKGIRIRLLVQNPKDLNRMVVKSDYAQISIPELELEIPSKTHVGEVTTVEGIVQRVIRGLSQDQKARELEDPEVAPKIDAFVAKLKRTLEVNEPFHLVVNDPSGNSIVENLCVPHKDPALEVSHYIRTKQEDEDLGIFVEEKADADEEPPGGSDEILIFQTNCYACDSPCETCMKPISIPHFKQVVIMATTCDSCGHRTNEVKSGSGIEPRGTRIKLNMKNVSDLNRDVLKSETCTVSIPELDFEVGSGTFGGRFTTVEGLLAAMKDQLKGDNIFMMGDGANPDSSHKMKAFLSRLDEVITGKRLVTIILDDPAGNSYLQNTYAPDPDPELEVVQYERNFEQNEDLGINDMKTENYGETTS